MNVGRRKLVWMLGLAGCAALVFLLWRQPWRRMTPDIEQDFPLPPFSQTRFLNTGPDAHYIGVQGCVECHGRQHQSYLHTAHSRALGDVDLDDEPPDGAFFHEASGRHYRVYRDGKTLRHEEVLRTADGKEIARLDLPIRYRIGSGSFTRSYLVEIDGFLHESPITWYTSRKKWDVSPGYDMRNHFSFERRVGLECLFCHAGRVEPAGDAVHRVKLFEQVIGCESCHGPGSLHRDGRRTGRLKTGDEDWTIVNPGKLTRPMLEAICSACHQSGAASIPLRGRSPHDFRPGRPLRDFRTDYRLDTGEEQMTVVGHMEQLRRSACYQKSDELTCLTCHDPHARERPKNVIAYYRQKCLDCHSAKGCGLDAPQRLKKDAADNCAACHMPRGDTEIPHIAFTHHRIGRHPAPPQPEPARVPELVPTDDISHLSPLDRQRNLGLAYVSASHDQAYARFAVVFRQRALALLESVHAAGLRNDDSIAALVELYQETDRERAVAIGRESIQGKGMSVHIRANVQYLVALYDIEDRQFPSAVQLLLDLTGRRRHAEDWRLLGMAHLQQDDPHKALAALQRALSMRPYRARIHDNLAEAHRLLGAPELAREHDEKAQWLYRHGQD